MLLKSVRIFWEEQQNKVKKDIKFDITKSNVQPHNKNLGVQNNEAICSGH